MASTLFPQTAHLEVDILTNQFNNLKLLIVFVKNNRHSMHLVIAPQCIPGKPGGAEFLPLIEIALFFAVAAKKRFWSPETP